MKTLVLLLILAGAAGLGLFLQAHMRSSLFDAVRACDALRLRALLDAGHSPFQVRRGGRTVLMEASLSGCIEITALLLEQGVPVQAADRAGLTALHFAAAEGHAPVIELLLRAGADPQAVSGAGRTPGELALARGHVQAGRLLSVFFTGKREQTLYPAVESL